MMPFQEMRISFLLMETPTQRLTSRWMWITRVILKMWGTFKLFSRLMLIRAGKFLPLPILLKMMDGLSGRSRRESWWLKMS
jgi:hypothetical protein